MSYEQKDMSGSLFKNAEKKTDNHPDYSGSGMIDGKAVWISGWKKESNGKMWLSLAFKPKDAKPAEPAKPAERADLDDDIPF